ncbi:MAG: triose-phosphate isomerase [bacterium]|nr:triose-phosphate isomerase [bacterium]
MADRHPLIAGNWKMNLTVDEAVDLAAKIRAGIAERTVGADVVVGPTDLCVEAVSRELKGTIVGVAGQNMHKERSGAYTGEVSGEMLRAAGANWVILGHSERRQYFGETDAGVAAKAVSALAAGLKPILCVGETLEERESGRTLEVVLGQVDGVLAGLPENELAGLTLAYEPVWAIGTGLTASNEQAQEVHGAIRNRLATNLGSAIAEKIRILYGGSVKPDNVAGLLALQDVDGALVGGASLDAESFLSLIPPLPST